MGGGGGQEQSVDWITPPKKVKNMLRAEAAGEISDIKRSAGEAKSMQGQDLASRGLGNTTVVESTYGAIDQRTQDYIGNVNENLSRELMGQPLINVSTPSSMMPSLLSGLGQSAGQGIGSAVSSMLFPGDKTQEQGQNPMGWMSSLFGGSGGGGSTGGSLGAGVSGAMSGAQMGTMIAPGPGTVIGAIIGGLKGLFLN